MIFVVALVAFLLGGLVWAVTGQPLLFLAVTIGGAIIALRLGATAQRERMTRAMRDAGQPPR